MTHEKPEIAEAVGVATTGKGDLGRLIEQAMSDAIAQAYKDGHADDPETVSEYMEAAREKAKADFFAAQEQPEAE